MRKILFVCHGNICRSPMAEAILKDKVHKLNKDSDFEIASMATSTEEIGNPVYPPAQRTLKNHNICDFTHRAKQVTIKDYAYYDEIYVFDSYNMRNILRLTDNDPYNKISMLGDSEIEDPWYSGEFEKVFKIIGRECNRILQAH